MKKLMTAMLGLSLLTGLASMSFARPDDQKTEESGKTKPKKAKKAKKAKKENKMDEKK